MKDEIELNNQNKKVEENEAFTKLKRDYEISPEALEQRLLLTAFLLGKKNVLIEERNRRKKKIEEEIIVLRGGQHFSRSQIKKYVTSLKQDYHARFPTSNPFFKNMFRLHPKLYGKDYNKFHKDYLAGKLLKQLTYNRFRVEFNIDILPALIVLAMPGGVRLHKCHEYLTPDGTENFLRFRDEANEEMEEFKDLEWYEFMKAFSANHGVVFQPRLIENY